MSRCHWVPCSRTAVLPCALAVTGRAMSCLYHSFDTEPARPVTPVWPLPLPAGPHAASAEPLAGLPRRCCHDGQACDGVCHGRAATAVKRVTESACLARTRAAPAGRGALLAAQQRPRNLPSASRARRRASHESGRSLARRQIHCGLEVC